MLFHFALLSFNQHFVFVCVYVRVFGAYKITFSLAQHTTLLFHVLLESRRFFFSLPSTRQLVISVLKLPYKMHRITFWCKNSTVLPVFYCWVLSNTLCTVHLWTSSSYDSSQMYLFLFVFFLLKLLCDISMNLFIDELPLIPTLTISPFNTIFNHFIEPHLSIISNLIWNFLHSWSKWIFFWILPESVLDHFGKAC